MNMKTHHVEIAVTCRVNGVLVINTLSSSVGSHPEEAVNIALQAASVVDDYAHQLQKRNKKSTLSDIVKSLTL